MGDKVSKLKQEMIEVYGLKCWLNELWIPKRGNLITYHHIIEKRNGGKAIWENGALLGRTSHDFLNKIDYTNHKVYNELNWLFFELNRTFMPPTEEYYEEVKRVLKKGGY